MINVIKSDFYKLFRGKAFYICGAIAAVWAALSIFIQDFAIKANFMMELDSEMMQMLGLNGISAISFGVGASSLLVAIIMSMFISSEFSFGTMKNIASRGISRANIYLSKVIIGAFAVVVYTLICAITAFATGSILWGSTGELTRTVYLDIFRMIGLYMLAEFAMQCVFMMIGFLIRSTGGVISVNLSIMIVFPAVVLTFINHAVRNWLNFPDFAAAKYWPVGYTGGTFLTLNAIPKDELITGLLVCAAYIIIPTLIGLFTFQKRDIK